MGAADRYEAEERKRHREWVRSMPFGRRCLHEIHGVVPFLVIGFFYLLIGAPEAIIWLLHKTIAQYGILECRFPNGTNAS